MNKYNKEGNVLIITPVKSERLTLRELEENDLMQIFLYAQDKEVFRYLEDGPFTKDETRLLLRKMISYQRENPRLQYELVAVLKTSGTIIGNCGIHISSLPNCEGWIDYTLNQKFWNQGFATEMTITLLDLAFNKLKLHRITATCLSTNTGSENVLIKCGLKQEGYLRKNKLIRGQWQDSFLYAILENEWISKIQ